MEHPSIWSGLVVLMGMDLNAQEKKHKSFIGYQ
jgi:hypothetical protein